MDHQEVNSEEITENNSINRHKKEEYVTGNVDNNCLNTNNHDDTTVIDPIEMEKKLFDLQNKYLLLAADFDNYRKRYLKQIEDIKKYSLEPIIIDLLEVIDNLDRALTSLESSEKNQDISINSLQEGIIKIRRQFITTLEKYGVTKIDTEIGSEFTPHFHEAIHYLSTDDKEKDGTICKITKDGYLLHSKVLRPTNVMIYKSDCDNIDVNNS